MDLAFYILIFTLGTFIGSFLNVVILRHNTGLSIAKGRSMCMTCGETLRWHELMPVISFLSQRGKCRVCKSKISWQYPVVEVTTGLLFLLSFMKIGSSPVLVYYLGIVSVLVVITIYDIKHKIIPDSFAFLFAGLAITKAVIDFSMDVTTFPELVTIFSAGIILALPFAALWYFSKGMWMGFGDAKLALGIGWFLGISQGVAAIILGFWIGAVVGVALIIWGRITRLKQSQNKFTMKSEIPFGPFLIMGTLIIFFSGMNLIDLVSYISVLS